MSSVAQHSLWVFDAAQRGGTIDYASLEEQFSFGYEPSWLATDNAYRLSPHFPLSEAKAASGTVRRFLENLLPEGRALYIVSTTHQVSKNNIFGLVRELGGETSGAFSFLSEGTVPDSRPTTYREILVDEMRGRIE